MQVFYEARFYNYEVCETRVQTCVSHIVHTGSTRFCKYSESILWVKLKLFPLSILCPEMFTNRDTGQRSFSIGVRKISLLPT